MDPYRRPAEPEPEGPGPPPEGWGPKLRWAMFELAGNLFGELVVTVLLGLPLMLLMAWLLAFADG